MEVTLAQKPSPACKSWPPKLDALPNDLVEDAMAGYLQELAQTREMLDGRYHALKNGRVGPLDGEKAFADLRRKSQERRS